MHYSDGRYQLPGQRLVTFIPLIRLTGCVTSFNDFYSRQRHGFFAYLMRCSGDYHLACDIMQESFARLLQRYSAENFTPQLLYTIGRNLVRDAQRQRNRDTGAPLAQEASGADPEHRLMVRAEYRRVLAAMQRLEADERDLLALVVSSDLCYREVAEITGLSEANVKVKIHRARKKLRTYLQAENP
jgi:RNA polymerase sigma-70 factor (ECF subfamily)